MASVPQFNNGDSGSDIRTLSLNPAIDKVNKSTGWAVYTDTTYTSGSPFSITGGVDTALPNDAGTTIKTQLPSDITDFYSGGLITGRDGDGLGITVSLKVKPTSASTEDIEMWIDIGGGVGEIFRGIAGFPKGNGVERPISSSILAYTGSTWESNGGTIYVRTDGPADIYDISYAFFRTHAAI